MLKRVSLSLLACFGLTDARADFDYDAGAGLITVDADGSASGFFVGGSYYFNTVRTSLGPLGAAVFLDKSSFVRAAVTEVDNGDSISLSSRFLLARQTIFELSYTDSDFDSSLELGLGKYLTDTSALLFNYVEGDDVDSLGVNYTSFLPLAEGKSWAYDVGLAYIDAPSDSGLAISGGVTYYPQSNLGVGATANISSAGDFDRNEFGINGQYFFNPSISGTVALLTQEVGDTDLDIITLGVEARF